MSWRLITALIVGAAALALAFPKADVWPLAWVALVPLIMSLHNSSPRRATLSGFLFGLVFYGILLHWVGLFGYLPWILLIIVEAGVIALFSAFGSKVMKNSKPWLRMAGIASLWVTMEWLQSLGPAGFTWGNIAHSQAYNLPIARLASVTGPWGVSFLIVLVNAAIVELVVSRTKQTKTAAVIAAVLLMAVFLWGYSSTYKPPGKALKVAVVQPCLPQLVDPSMKYFADQWKRYKEMTEDAVRMKPDFIVWPESAIPYDIDRSAMVSLDMRRISEDSSADIITGGTKLTIHNGQAREQNGAYVINRDGVRDRYYKVRLVPFGEYVPARKWLTIAERYGVREVDYLAGSGWHPLETSHGKAGAVICFESIFPQISRVLVSHGAKILFVLTNDGWFERTSAAEQHLQMSVYRAIENGRYVVRSTTTGISAVIAPDGRITSRLGLWEPGIMQGTVETLTHRTIYNRFGDWFAYVSLVAMAVLLVQSRVNRESLKLPKSRKGKKHSPQRARRTQRGNGED